VPVAAWRTSDEGRRREVDAAGDAAGAARRSSGDRAAIERQCPAIARRFDRDAVAIARGDLAAIE